MNQLNRTGLYTVALTAVISLSVALLYFTVDSRIHIGEKYASLFKALEDYPPARGPAVAGIRDSEAPPTPTGLYTSLYIAEQGQVAESDLFSKERVTSFIESHQEPLDKTTLQKTLPLSSSSEDELLNTYAHLPQSTGREVLTLLDLPTENQSAAAQGLLSKLETTLLDLERAGTAPQLAASAQYHAGVLEKTVSALHVLLNSSADRIGGFLAAAQLKQLSILLDDSTNAILKGSVDGVSCGFCLSSENMLEYAVQTQSGPPSVSPVP